MAYERRGFSGGAVQTTITGSINSGDTEIVLASATGWPSGADDFFLVIDRGTASEEVVRASARAGTTVTLSERGADGTTAVSHSGGASAEHCLTALDLDEANAHLSGDQANPHPEYLTEAQADAAYQPLDSDLSAISALATTPHGRSLLADANAAASRATIGAAPSATFPVTIGVALSDETTTITTGTAKATIRAPFAFSLTAVRASVNTASSSGTPTVDINEGGSTLLSTKLTIDANEKTSTTAASAAVISDSAIADDAEITFDIDVAGTGAKGLKVYLIGTRSL